jgi:peptide/nickel transport system substrate-binding protein
MVKNPEYHISGLPYVDGITWIQSTDPAVNKAQFLTGKIDSFSPAQATEAMQMLQQRPGAQLQVVSPVTTAIHFRFKLEGPMADVRVRQALTKAVDWPSAWQAAAGGNLFLGTIIPFDQLGLTMPMTPDQAGPNYQYDPDAAKKLMAGAGFPNGFSIAIVTTDGSGVGYGLDLALQQFWNKTLNVQAKIQVIDAVSHTQAAVDRTWQGLWQNVTLVLGSGTNLADSSLQQWVTGSAQNFSGISDPVLDDIFRRQQSEVDPTKRLDLLWQFINRNQEMLWIMPIGHLVSFLMYQPWEMNAAGNVYAFAGSSGSGWTPMIDLSKLPKR